MSKVSRHSYNIDTHTPYRPSKSVYRQKRRSFLPLPRSLYGSHSMKSGNLLRLLRTRGWKSYQITQQFLRVSSSGQHNRYRDNKNDD